MLRLACVPVVLLFSVSALADERTRLMRDADAAMLAGRHAQARNIWRAIWEIDRSARVACNIGELSFSINDVREAAEWLTVCLQLQAPPRTPLQREFDARRRTDLALAKQRVGTIEVFTNREGAKVSVAGRPAETGTPVFVNPGTVVVTAHHKDRVARVEVDVPAGEERVAIIDFRKPPPAPLAPPAPVVVAPPIVPVRPASVPMQNVPSVGSTNRYFAVIGTGVALTAIAVTAGVIAHFGARKASEDADDAGVSVTYTDPGDCRKEYVPDCGRRDHATALQRDLTELKAASFTLAGVFAAGTVTYAIIDRPTQATPLPLVALQIERPGSVAVVVGVKGTW